MKKTKKKSDVAEIIDVLKKYDGDKTKEAELVIQRLEKFDDFEKLDHIERYKKAYQAGRQEKCVNILIDIAMLDSKNFKRRFLMANGLLNPLGNKFDETEYEKTVNILLHVLNRLKGFISVEEDYKEGLREMLYYTRVLFHNSQTNTNRLDNNKFSEYSLSEQLHMICIFLQDQTRQMEEELNKRLKNRQFITGLEAQTTLMDCAYNENRKISVSDNYEANLETFNTLIQYLYYLRSDELRKNKISNPETIHPFRIPSLEEITIIARQRMLYEKLEERFRYSNWNVKYGFNREQERVYLFEAGDKAQIIAHHTAVIRRQRLYGQITSAMSLTADMAKGIKAIDHMANFVNADSFEAFRMSKEDYGMAKKYMEPMLFACRKLCKQYYFECKIGDLSVEDLINGYTFLGVISKLYIKAAMKVFDPHQYSKYHYLAPVVNIDYFVDSFMEVYEAGRQKAEAVIGEFIYDEKSNKDRSDVFTRPLIKISKTQVILCQAFIENMNMNRNIEKAMQRKKVSFEKAGRDFEREVIDRLKNHAYIKVNTNPVEFLACDGRNVEFDFIGVLDDCLILMEFKSLLTPYDDKELSDRRKTIHEAVDQVLRREKIVGQDWSKIKEAVNIDLPDKPYEEDKIIKIVCSDIFDFTALSMDGVRITDDSTLIKYFTGPYINKYNLNKEFVEVESPITLWKTGKPNIHEFLEYLDQPVTVTYIKECLEEKECQVIRFTDDETIIFKDMYLNEAPHIHIGKSEKTQKNQKIYPNQPCPCKSGKKYKKCCGTLR